MEERSRAIRWMDGWELLRGYRRSKKVRENESPVWGRGMLPLLWIPSLLEIRGMIGRPSNALTWGQDSLIPASPKAPEKGSVISEWTRVSPNPQRSDGESQGIPMWGETMEALTPFICHGLKCHLTWWNDHEAVRSKLLVSDQDHEKGGLRPWRQSWWYPQLCCTFTIVHASQTSSYGNRASTRVGSDLSLNLDPTLGPTGNFLTVLGSVLSWV